MRPLRLHHLQVSREISNLSPFHNITFQVLRSIDIAMKTGRNIEGVVFDLDATLVNLGGHVDWRRAHRLAKEVYVSCGCPRELVESSSERGLFTMLNLVRDENSTEMPASQVEQIQGEAYGVIESCELEGVEMCSLMPSCVSTLEWIEGQGMAMGVATSNSQLVAESVLDLNGIRRFFASVVGRRPELKMKPYPDQILICLEEMGVEPRQGLMVGDSVKDIQAAKAAGITMISIPSYFTKREAIVRASPDVILENLGELPEAVSRLDGVR